VIRFPSLRPTYFGWNHSPGRAESEVTAYPGVTERVSWICLDSPLKKISALLEFFRRGFPPVITTFQIELIRLNIVCVALQNGVFFFAQQLDLQSVDYCQGNFVLYFEDVFHLSIVTLRPQLISV